MPRRFVATENAVEKGLAETKPDAGAKLVHDWITELSKVDETGAKGLHADLVQLEKELKKDNPDSDHVKKVLGKLGPATVKIADKCVDEKVADKVRSLGTALTHAAG